MVRKVHKAPLALTRKCLGPKDRKGQPVHREPRARILTCPDHRDRRARKEKSVRKAQSVRRVILVRKARRARRALRVKLVKADPREPLDLKVRKEMLVRRVHRGRKVILAHRVRRGMLVKLVPRDRRVTLDHKAPRGLKATSGPKVPRGLKVTSDPKVKLVLPALKVHRGISALRVQWERRGPRGILVRKAHRGHKALTPTLKDRRDLKARKDHRGLRGRRLRYCSKRQPLAPRTTRLLLTTRKKLSP